VVVLPQHPAPPHPSSTHLPAPGVSRAPIPTLTPPVGFLFRGRHYLPNVGRREEIENRLATPPVGKELPDPPPALPPPCLLPHFRPEDLMLPLPLRTHLEEVVCRLCWALTPPALGVGAVFGPVQLLSGTAVPPPSAGRVARQARWCSQRPCHRATHC